MYLNTDYILDFENKKLVFTEKGLSKLSRKLITGSNIYSISKYKKSHHDRFLSPFSDLVSRFILSQPIYDELYVNAGKFYESKIFEKLKEKFPNAKFKLIDDTKVPDRNYFNHDIFGGIPDVLMESEGKRIVIDIKTAKNKWKGHPKYDAINKETYKAQVNLYRELLDFDEAWIAISYLEYPNDYLNYNDEVEMPKILNVTDKKWTNELMENAKHSIDEIVRSGEICGFDVERDFVLLQLLSAKNIETRNKIHTRMKILKKKIHKIIL